MSEKPAKSIEETLKELSEFRAMTIATYDSLIDPTIIDSLYSVARFRRDFPESFREFIESKPDIFKQKPHENHGFGIGERFPFTPPRNSKGIQIRRIIHTATFPGDINSEFVTARENGESKMTAVIGLKFVASNGQPFDFYMYQYMAIHDFMCEFLKDVPGVRIVTQNSDDGSLQIEEQ